MLGVASTHSTSNNGWVAPERPRWIDSHDHDIVLARDRGAFGVARQIVEQSRLLNDDGQTTFGIDALDPKGHPGNFSDAKPPDGNASTAQGPTMNAFSIVKTPDLNADVQPDADGHRKRSPRWCARYRW